MVFRKRRDDGRRHHHDHNKEGREERKREKMRASASGDVGLELLNMNRKNVQRTRPSATNEEPLDPFPTIGRGSSTFSLGSIMSFDNDLLNNAATNKKQKQKKKQQQQPQQHIHMWDAAAVAKKKIHTIQDIQEPKAVKTKSKKHKTSKKQTKKEVDDDDFDLEPTIIKRLNQAAKQQSMRSLLSQETTSQCFSSQPENDEVAHPNNRHHPTHDDDFHEPHRPAKSNHLLGLVDHGDWQDLENLLQKQNHRKNKNDRTQSDEYDSASCSSYSESSGGESSQAESSSHESQTSSSDSSHSVKTNDELSDDESRNENQASDHEHEVQIRKKIARMKSSELRRWNGFKPQVQELLERCNMPHDIVHVDILLEQFENREAELLASLQSMAAKFPRQNRATIHKSKHFDKRIASYMSYGTAEALAHIAAACTLDENPIAVKPEYVVDAPVERSESEECSDSYYDDDDEDEEEESFESESESEEHDNYEYDEDEDSASQSESESNPSQSNAESIESNDISLEETDNLTVHEGIHHPASSFAMSSGVAFSEQVETDDDESFFDRHRDQQSDESSRSYSPSREGSQEADWSYSGHDDEDDIQQFRSNIRGKRFGYR